MLRKYFHAFAIKITDLLIGLLPRKRHALLVAHIIIISSHLKTWTTPASVRRLRPRQYFRRSVPTLLHATTAAVKNRTESTKRKVGKGKVFVAAVDCFILFSTLLLFFFFSVVLRKNLVFSQRRILRLMRL